MAPFPRIFTKNWQLKLLAVGVAVLLWTVPRFEAQDTRVLEDVPVEVSLTDPDWALVDQSPTTVNVTVSGPARDLIALEFDRPPVLVPLVEVTSTMGVTSTDTTVTLNASWFRVPGLDGVVVEVIRPGAVNLNLERMGDRRVALSVALFGELPDTISLAGPPEIIPSTASVVGPVSRLEGIDSIRLVPIDLARVTGPDTIVQPVDSTGLEGLEILTAQASVVLPIEPTAEREFPDLRLSLPQMDSDPPLQARPAQVTVVVSGAGTLLESFDPRTMWVGIKASAANLLPGEEEMVLVSVDGVPAPLTYRVDPEWILLRRPVGR